jgi:hypothetical protein
MSFTGIFLRLAPDLNSWQFLSWRSLASPARRRHPAL